VGVNLQLPPINSDAAPIELGARVGTKKLKLLDIQVTTCFYWLFTD
jgi:hypothetical protein